MKVGDFHGDASVNKISEEVLFFLRKGKLLKKVEDHKLEIV